MLTGKRPNLLKISTQQCAKEALKGFDANKAQIIPGFIFRWLMWFYSFVPSFVVRTFGKLVVRGIRGEEVKMLEKKRT